jgi:hypothetical protein
MLLSPVLRRPRGHTRLVCTQASQAGRYIEPRYNHSIVMLVLCFQIHALTSPRRRDRQRVVAYCFATFFQAFFECSNVIVLRYFISNGMEAALNLVVGSYERISALDEGEKFPNGRERSTYRRLQQRLYHHHWGSLGLLPF